MTEKRPSETARRLSAQIEILNRRVASLEMLLAVDGHFKEIRGTHPDHFRTGMWAKILTIVEHNRRRCFYVQFPDGIVDYWAVEAEWKYEFR